MKPAGAAEVKPVEAESLSAEKVAASGGEDKAKKFDKSKKGQWSGKGRIARRSRPRVREEKEFEQRSLDIARVTRVTKGGKRMSFRSLIVIGDERGRVGFGLAKGADVAISMAKAYIQAKKNVINVPIVKETIPHEVRKSFGAAEVLLKPATRGSGIKAGGALRVILELAGVPNATGKIIGSKNKINNVRAAFMALESLRHDSERKDK
ncbi:30S ribosomal protein S5 [Patescibacteria group bacterium]|nr:30S ribosomal protein S5 [Patescibacteria group bacterium]